MERMTNTDVATNTVLAILRKKRCVAVRADRGIGMASSKRSAEIGARMLKIAMKTAKSPNSPGE
jgi:hypothetical protein